MTRAPYIADQNCDQIRINDLVLSVYLQTGAHWPSGTEELVEQPISISLIIFHNVSETAKSDDLSHSIDYADISNRIRASMMFSSFACLQDLSRQICNTIGTFSILENLLDGLGIHLMVKQSKAHLNCATVSVEHFARFSADGSWVPEKISHSVENLTCPTIIGVGVAERLEEQNVVVNVSIGTAGKGLGSEDWIDLRELKRMLYQETSTSRSLTLEALTSCVASATLSLLLSYQLSPVVSVRIAKPSALAHAASAEIQILRTPADYAERIGPTNTAVSAASADRIEGELHTAAIALGSNLGDSFRNIEYALRLLEIPSELLRDAAIVSDLHPVINIVNTSFLYESAPMYVTDQPQFINCACMVETNLFPSTLLYVLKEIESIVGRVPSMRNGPRAVDLDIIFYDNEVIDTRSTAKDPEDLEGELVIPHPRLQEREFVLRPLNDMIPEYIHPILKKTVASLFRETWDPTIPPMNKVIPYPRFPITSSTSFPYPSISPVPDTLSHWTYPSIILPTSKPKESRKTHIMATLNVTPDSFSDGSKHDALPAALKYACSSVIAGAGIVDIGGYSTRPGATFVSVEEEIRRVVPVVTAMRDANILQDVLGQIIAVNDNISPGEVIEKTMTVPISVDTFRWEVAEAAIKVGANCINDVYAFTGPNSWPASSPGSEKGGKAAEYMAKMKAIARKYAVPVILMHSRGDAGKEKDYSQYAYAAAPRDESPGQLTGGQTLEGVRVELGNKVNEIVLGKGGVRRWLVIADPGIGFSKTLEGNLEVLRNAREVVADGMIGGDEPYRNPLTGYPQLIGVSKKSFLGAILAQNKDGRETRASDRAWATAAAVTCAVQQGPLIVRVHDVKEMMDVVTVADALWS